LEGIVAATDVLMIMLAATAFRYESDFKWVLVGIAAHRAPGMVRFWFEA